MSKVKNTTQKGKTSGEDIQIRRFKKEDLPAVYRLIQDTIDVSYRKVYPPEAIYLFKENHNREIILNDASVGYTIVAEQNNKIIGTGTLFETNIRRVYISPLHQRRGIGKLIAQELERQASRQKLASLDLSASLVSRRFWETVGFIVREELFIPVRNGQKLRFYEMTKEYGM
jgi:GNAT superfamily N-acetyltransferase